MAFTYREIEGRGAEQGHQLANSNFQAISKDPTLSVPLNAWYKIARTATWTSIVDVRRAYPTADFVAPYTVFNIKGNRYRLVTKIEYRWQLVFIKGVLTHAEYDREDWKK